MRISPTFGSQMWPLLTLHKLSLQFWQSSWSIDFVPLDNHIQWIKPVVVVKALEQSWSASSTTPDGMWLMQVTSSELDAAGGLWPPCHYVSGLIITTPSFPTSISAASFALIHFCNTSLLLYFSLPWSHLTSSSQSLIHLASNPHLSLPPTLPPSQPLLSQPSSPLLHVQQDWRPVGASPSHPIALFTVPKKGNGDRRHRDLYQTGS